MLATDPTVLVVKATILLGGGLALGRALSHASPAMRHRLWSGTLAAALALPALALVAPQMRVPVPGWRQEWSETAPSITAPGPRASRASRASRDHATRSLAPRLAPGSVHASTPPGRVAAAAPSRFSIPSSSVLIAALWIAGALAVLSRLVIAMRRARRLASTSHELTDPAWVAACQRLGDALGLRGRVRLVASPHVATPMAGGMVRPTIFLPASSATWSDDVRDVVLAHELAHLARRDPMRHFVSRAALAVYWFHPFAWLVARRAVTTCEQACDDAVLTLGIRPSTYAGVLLEFANATQARPFAAALPMVRPSQLEDRLMAILNFSRRASSTRGAILTVAVAAVATPLIAAIQPARTTAPAPAVSRAHPAARAMPRSAASADDACTWDGLSGGFSGTMTRTGSSRGDQRLIGTTDSDRVIQTSFGDLRVCAVGEGMARGSDDAPSAWPAHARRVLLETSRSGDVRRMEIAGGSTTWTVNGESRPVDASAQAWRDRLLALLDPTWQLSQLRGRVSSLRGQISSVEGQRSSMEGEISSLRGQVSSMQGEISSVRGQVSSMEGEISSVRGHLSSLRGEISSERGAISSLDASGGSDADVRRHEDAIRDIQNEITRYDADGRVRQIEARIASFNADSQVAAIEQRLRTFNVDSQVAAVRQRIDRLDVEGQTKRIESEIAGLHEDTRGRDLQSKIDAAARQLRDVLGGH